MALGKRGLEYEVAYGKWAAPGGYVEGENGCEASYGEFQEELGVDISHVSLKHVHELYDSATFCWNHFYAGVWPDGEPPQLQITRESSEVKIWLLDELPELAFAYQAEFIRQAAAKLLN